jgi:hypothetical protein
MCHVSAGLRSLLGAWPLWLRIGLSGALMAVLLWRQDWTALASAVTGVSPTFWLIGLGIFLLSQVVSAARWWSFALPLGFTDGFGRFLRLYFEGMFFSLCLPSSIGGDVVKALRVNDTARGRMLGACSVVADRLAGLCAVLIIGLAALTARELRLASSAAAWIGAAYFVLAALFAAVGLRASGWLSRRWLSRRWFGETRLGAVARQLDPYHDRPWVFCRGILLGLVVQGLNVLGVIALGQGIGLRLPLEVYFAVVPLVALATTLPISMNGVGVREGAMALLLKADGVPVELSTALAVVWFTVQVAAGLLGGIVYAAAPPLTYQQDFAAEPPGVAASAARRAA